LDKSASAQYVARAMQPYLRPATPIYSVEMYEQTLPYYLRRTVTLVAERDELDFGLKQEPQRSIATLTEFRDHWRADDAPLAIMPPSTFATLRAMDFPMRVILSDHRFVVIAKP